MRYNPLGRTGLKASVIGLGMEHLLAPEILVPTVHAAIDRGVNYIDLMIPRPDVQDTFGLALQGRRDRAILAGHLGVGHTQGQYRRTRDVKECREIFHDLLRRLDTDHVDVLNISYVDAAGDYRRVTEPGGVMELALRLKQEGRARFLGMSGHNAVTAMQAVKDGHLDVLMYPVSLAWSANSSTQEVCALCAERGVGLVAMKPFGGGEVFQRQTPVATAKCLHYTLSQPGVSVALMGVKNTAELAANLRYLEAGDEEKDLTSALREFSQFPPGTCVYCNHCLPCPVEIDIGHTVRLLVNAQQWGMGRDLRDDYADLLAPASACIECGVCLDRCPFGVDIIGKLKQTAEMFESRSLP